jgi:hypothetical protein
MDGTMKKMPSEKRTNCLTQMMDEWHKTITWRLVKYSTIVRDYWRVLMMEAYDAATTI